MCDVNAFVIEGGVEEKILENVDLVEQVAGGMRLVNIFGEEKMDGPAGGNAAFRLNNRLASPSLQLLKINKL